MWVSLLNKTKPYNYPETSKVNPAGIRWKECILNWGGLTDVQMFFFFQKHGVKLAVRSQQTT
ncbi:MAG: hypothetical protein EGR83_23550 [Bacteroides cellulosilyticus]|nr:hypothetical protein [Bacteroides cellulosilyticus]